MAKKSAGVKHQTLSWSAIFIHEGSKFSKKDHPSRDVRVSFFVRSFSLGSSKICTTLQEMAFEETISYSCKDMYHNLYDSVCSIRKK